MTFKPVKVALIGLGAWGGEIARAIRKSKKLTLVSCFDVDKDSCRTFAGKYQCRPAPNYQSILDNKEIDGVILIIPNHLHPELTIQAANAQKHIFIDKPIANNVKQATEMVKCCEENHVILSVGHNFRKSSCYRRIKEMINDGSIGKVVSVEGNLSHDGGLNLSPKDWRWFQNKCPSGPLIQLGIHQIDTLNYLLGPVKKVSAFSNHLYTPAEIKDVAVILLEYKSGILGYVGTNYVSPLISFTNIMATGANLFCENREKLYIQKKGSGNKENVVLENIDTELAEIDEFASCIRDGKKPEVDGKTAIEALAVVEAAIISNRTGKTVLIEDVLKKETDKINETCF